MRRSGRGWCGRGWCCGDDGDVVRVVPCRVDRANHRRTRSPASRARRSNAALPGLCRVRLIHGRCAVLGARPPLPVRLLRVRRGLGWTRHARDPRCARTRGSRSIVGSWTRHHMALRYACRSRCPCSHRRLGRGANPRHRMRAGATRSRPRLRRRAPRGRLRSLRPRGAGPSAADPRSGSPLRPVGAGDVSSQPRARGRPIDGACGRP